LNGGLALVPHGPLATLAIADVASDGGRALLFLPTDAAGLDWTPVETMDATVPRFDLRARDVVLPPGARLVSGDAARTAIAGIESEWRTMLAAETLGACEAMVEMTGAYVKDRIQFGRPVGANQAVKTRIAEMAWQTGRMRAAVYNAALHIEQASPGAELASRLAKAVAADGGGFVGTQAIHCHGGVGFTWEHDVHIYFKRAKSNELFLGDAAESFARIAEGVL
jgi:alkylation response protein AidB-like acyl-CoA dehydrogenase